MNPAVTRCLRLVLCLFSLLLVLPAEAGLKSISSAASGSRPVFVPAAEAFQLVPSEEAQGLRLEFNVREGYYLYRDRFHFTSTDSRLKIGEPVFSLQGEWKDDPSFGRVRVYHEDVVVTLPLSGKGRVKVAWQGCADAGLCYPPQDQLVSFGEVEPEAAAPATIAAKAPVPDNKPAKVKSDSLSDRLLALLLMFSGGLLLSFSPCTLPMLPILAGIIARQHTSSALRGFFLALSYVFGVATVYALMGFVVGFFGQQVNLPGLFQQPVVLIVFALLFLALALSLFGLFELRLPAALQSRFDALSRRQKTGALGGSFMIGLFSALVVSPCVSAPLFGVLLKISTSGEALFGAALLFVMALGMGVPLLILGATEGRLLPKSGAWMDEVKFFFGLMLLFVAAELLTRMSSAPVALALYAFCTAATGFWLWRIGGTTNPLRLLLRALAFCVLVYAAALVGGAASGGDDPLRPLAQISSQSQAATATPFIRVKNTAELDAEIARAKADGKAVMLDFYADWCVSCKVMERNVFRKPEVAARLGQLRLLQADVTRNNADDQALLKRFSLLGPPTIVFYGRDGQELLPARLVGEKNARDFLAHLDEYGL